MRKALLWGILLALFFIVPLRAEEPSDPLARRLTDFLPAYTPFVSQAPPDRYFPDEVGKQIAEAIIDTYLQNPQALEKHYQDLASKDAELAAKGELPTGVAPYIHNLKEGLTPESQDEEREDVFLASASAEDLLREADRLLAEEKRGKVGRKFNWLLSSVNLTGIFFGTPARPNIYETQRAVSSFGETESMSPRERKALVLYSTFLRQAPEDPRAGEVKEKVRRLEEQKEQALLEKELKQAEAWFHKKDYWRANFHYQLALLVDGDAPQVHEGLARVEKRLQQRNKPWADRQPVDALAGIRQAQWEHEKDTMKYLLPGGRYIKDNIVVAGAQIVTEGLVGAVTFGTLALVNTGAKVFQLLTGNPISHQPIITEGEKYLHKTPAEKRDPEVYGILATAYEKEGRYDKAIEYYRLAGQEEKVPALQERAAQALLHMAEESPHQAQKESYLRRLVEHYPNTKAVRKAAPQLRELVQPENRGLKLSKAFLREHPELSGASGLGLKETLFDRDRDNVEIANEGVTLLANGEIVIYLQSEEGSRAKRYVLPEGTWDRFWRRLREEGYKQARKGDDQGMIALMARGAAQDIRLKGRKERNEEEGWRLLPYMAGSLSGSYVDLHGTLPPEIAGTRMAFGTDQNSPYTGMELPMPFVPVDFLFIGRTGSISLFPQIRLPESELKDAELYQ
jgi:tetratricopeptide (TPR) repeat protein